MNVARLELCRELFELSRWDNHSEHGDWLPDKNGQYEVRGGPWYNKNTRIPAYDLGYLLRKLPSEISIEKKYNHEDGVMYYAEANTGFESADTPEDAAVKLAIDLFRQGVLKKEETP